MYPEKTHMCTSTTSKLHKENMLPSYYKADRTNHSFAVLSFLNHLLFNKSFLFHKQILDITLS